MLDAAESEGFHSTAKDDWNYELERSSNGLSIAFGALAGKKFYLKYILGFSVDADGNLVARLSRDSAGSALRGGAIGASKASSTFQEVANAVANAATQAGIFAADRTLG